MVAFFREVPQELRFLLLVAGALLLLVSPVFRPDLSDPLVADYSRGFEARLAEETSPTLRLEGSWRVTPEGFTVTDGESLLRITPPAEAWKRVEIRLVAPSDTLWRVRVGRGYQNRILPNVRPGDELSFEGDMIPGDPDSDLPVVIGVASANATAGDEALLSRVNVKASLRGSKERPFNLAGFLLLPLLPFAATAFLLYSGRRSLRVSTSIAGALSIGAAVALRLNPQFFDAIPAAIGALFLAGAAGATMKRLRGESEALTLRAARLTEALALAGVLAVAVAMRWDMLLENWGNLLLPDARGYLQIAREGSFYQTAQDHAPWVREPLFPALLRLWLRLAPDTVNSARFCSMLLGLLPIALTWAVGRKLFSPLVGLLAAGVMAATPFLANLSIQVLRDDLLTTLILAVLAAECYLGRCRWWRAVLLGLVGGLLALTRVNFLFLAPLGFLGLAIARRWNPLELALAVALTVLPVIPHLLYNSELMPGRPLYSSDVHLRYYANRDHIGEPGFPATFAQWNADPYAGGLMTSGEFLGLYPTSELVLRSLRGLVTIFAFEYPHGLIFRGNELVMLFGLLGVWGWWLRRREAWIAVPWYLWVMGPVALIATITLDYRLAAPATPIIVWTWAAGVEVALLQLLRVMGVGKTKSLDGQ